MWEPLDIETKLQSALNNKFSAAKGQEYFAYYVSARTALLESILPEIKAKEPDLTDHGPVHIKNVLDNAYHLLGKDIEFLTALELYILCVAILFHDVGNLHGRVKHNKNIAQIYDFVRKEDPKFRDEKIAVMQIAGAHTGYSKDGKKDTLVDLGNGLPVFSEPIKAQKVAAVLRFADELAEGPQRTSVYMQNNHGYAENSTIYHEYALLTTHCIDKNGARIAVNYHIELDLDDSGQVLAGKHSLNKMLRYVYTRVEKLDQERRYNKHYCHWLDNFKKTSATFNFSYGHDFLELGISPLELSDLIVPGDAVKKIEDIDNNYSIENITKLLTERMGES